MTDHGTEKSGLQHIFSLAIIFFPRIVRGGIEEKAMDFPKNERGGWIIPDNTVIPVGTIIPAFSMFGNGCQLGDDCRLGNDCQLGAWCQLGNGCKFGNGCQLGNDCQLGAWCKIEGIIAKRWMTAANIDGSGRQILIVWDGTQTKVRAGCFVGSVDEFVAKAKSEGKMRYARVIPAMVAAMIGDGEE